MDLLRTQRIDGCLRDAKGNSLNGVGMQSKELSKYHELALV
jgi:hypothetical protein